MTDGQLRIAQLASTLLLGGAGYAYLHTLFVRPRVYRVFRRLRTIQKVSSLPLEAIETALREKKIPTGFRELEWWNAGRRAASDIIVEVVVPGRVLAWEIQPPATDLAAPWTCVIDPLRSSDGRTLRVSQGRLMPSARSHVMIGFDVADHAAKAQVRLYTSGRTVGPPRVLGVVQLAGGFLVLAFAMTVAIVVGLWAKAHIETELLRAPVVLGAFFGGLLIVYPFRQLLEHGGPSWTDVLGE